MEARSLGPEGLRQMLISTLESLYQDEGLGPVTRFVGKKLQTMRASAGFGKEVDVGDF